MDGHASSAEPQKLFRYAIRSLKIDGELAAAANRLAAVLAEFQATCTEPMLRPPILDHLLTEMRALAHLAEETDRWVYQVGREFAAADQNAALPSPAASDSFTADTGSPAMSAPVAEPVAAADDAVHAGPAETGVEPPVAPLPPPVPAPAAPTPSPRSFFSQQVPVGDEQVLATARFEQPGHFEFSQISGREIRTVRDHLREYGCLMTNHAMLLNDSGEPLTVTDLYKANFTAKTGQLFDQAAANGSITLPDLTAHHNMVAVATDGRYQLGYGVLQGDPVAALSRAVGEQGAVVLQAEVNGHEHWLIVDHANGDGTFDVRDPVRGLRNSVHITTGGFGDYHFQPTGAYQYLIKSR